MRDLYRSNYLSAFNTASKLDDNNAGGIALWTAPETIQCAFNPIVFTRDKYYHKTTGYEPPFTQKPNYAHFSGGTITFDYPLVSSVSVIVARNGGAGYTVESIGAGRQTWTVSGFTISAIVGITLENNATTSVRKNYDYDGSYVYVRQGYSYCDDNYMCNTNGEVLYRNTEVDTSSLKIYKTDGSYFTLKAESYYGTTKFDCSPVVKGWLRKEPYDFTQPNSKIVESDMALSVRYKVNCLNSSGMMQTYLAVNAVAQIGENPNLASWVSTSTISRKFLTDFNHLYYYPGYEFDAAILVNSAFAIQGITLLEKAVSRLALDNRNAQRASYGVVERCVPENPFYVRWINRRGGIDYWMFSRTQKINESVKSASSYNPYTESPLSAKTNVRNYAITTENTITVGVDQVDSNDYNVLRCIAFARKIQYYNKTLQKWLDLTVSKFDGVQHTKSNTHSIEVTFGLPDINIQY